MHKFFHINLLSTAIIVFIWSIFNSFELSLNKIHDKSIKKLSKGNKKRKE